MQEKAAICEICGEEIWIDADPAPASSWARGGLQAVVERAAQEHLARHPTAVVERFLLRKHLDELAPDVRPVAVKQVYSQLRELWGDEDQRPVYSIDEALGCMAVYRLWCNTNRCTWEHCRHTAP
jgi:hypothetical protein